MQKYYKNISWETYNLPQALKKRGIDVVDKLPNFYYRDDSLKLWTAIEEFVKQILAIYYRSDDDIKEVSPLWLMFVFYYEFKIFLSPLKRIPPRRLCSQLWPIFRHSVRIYPQVFSCRYTLKSR